MDSVKGNWGISDVPKLAGKLAVVTGATGGLGYENALELARAGAEVIVAGRSEVKGANALRRIRTAVPEARVRFELVDLANLKSIGEFSGRLLKEDRPIDILVNNAGVMALPKRETTQEGFELQFGTNHLAHFALTGQLLPLLRRSGEPRVVTVSSLMHKVGVIHFDDLQWKRGYKPTSAYAQSKLANLLFTKELQRRSDAHGWGLMSNAAHPGGSSTDLIANGPGTQSFMGRISPIVVRIIGHSVVKGALPTLFAATSPEAMPAGYYGPKGMFELKGRVGEATVSDKANDASLARGLWDVSEELTGVFWPTAREFAVAGKR